jgi:hypothetical protein
MKSRAVKVALKEKGTKRKSGTDNETRHRHQETKKTNIPRLDKRKTKYKPQTKKPVKQKLAAVDVRHPKAHMRTPVKAV